MSALYPIADKRGCRCIVRFVLQADISTSSRGVCFASAFGRYKLLTAGVQIIMAGRVLMAVILIVEDDSFIRETAEMMIQDLGHQTLSASDVDEALLLLRAPQHIDALFTDIYLRPLLHGGCDLAQQAIALRPDLRVLYTTGSAIDDKVKAIIAGGVHFLPKPYTQDQLQDSIKELLAA
jgi:CheY-like chemotaxis protein